MIMTSKGKCGNHNNNIHNDGTKTTDHNHRQTHSGWLKCKQRWDLPPNKGSDQAFQHTSQSGTATDYAHWERSGGYWWAEENQQVSPGQQCIRPKERRTCHWRHGMDRPSHSTNAGHARNSPFGTQGYGRSGSSVWCTRYLEQRLRRCGLPQVLFCWWKAILGCNSPAETLLMYMMETHYYQVGFQIVQTKHLETH
jgi:hypothetical protein